MGLHTSNQNNRAQYLNNTSIVVRRLPPWHYVLSLFIVALEVFIQRKCVPISIVRGSWHNAHFLVLSYSLLKEVCLAFQRDQLHEVKWIFFVVDLKANVHLLYNMDIYYNIVYGLPFIKAVLINLVPETEMRSGKRWPWNVTGLIVHCKLLMTYNVRP